MDDSPDAPFLLPLLLSLLLPVVIANRNERRIAHNVDISEKKMQDRRLSAVVVALSSSRRRSSARRLSTGDWRLLAARCSQLLACF